MNILSGKLNKREMSRFIGSREVDKSLDRLSDLGYIKYRKVKSGYEFTLYSRPVTVRKLDLRNN